jgi:hypothetical protein
MGYLKKKSFENHNIFLHARWYKSTENGNDNGQDAVGGI